MSITVKVFFEKANGPKEIRRFPVDTNNGDCFIATKEKVKQLYPTLGHGRFILYWQDSDGDRVAFSSMEEMKEAIANVSDGVLRIYIPEPMDEAENPSDETPGAKPKQTTPPRPQQQQQEQQQQQQHQQPSGAKSGPSQGPQSQSNHEPVHVGVTCDGCEGPVVGLRFKCCVCPDYDLCQRCEGNGMHTEHDMYKITTPRVNPLNFLPPHVGRYISRCMKNMTQGAESSSSASASASSGAGANANSGATSAEGTPNTEKKARANYDEWLKSVGANIAAFLDPFGIDVTYDIHHNNSEQQQGRCHRGAGGWGRGRGRGFNAWEGMRRGAQREGAPCGGGPQGAEKKEEEKERRKQTDMETDTPKADEAAASPMSHDKADSDHSGDGWTFVEPEGNTPMVDINAFIIPTQNQPQNGQPDAPIPMPAPPTAAPAAPASAPSSAPTQAPTPPPRPSTGPQPTGTNIYPNLRIQQAVEQMLAMGFTNTDGWLSDLLSEHDGDIGATLDAIKAKATQQLENLRTGH